MKREDQIRAEAVTRAESQPSGKKTEFLRWFEYGAYWADQFPANPWHNVNDRMPNDHEKIFFRKKDGSKYCGWFDEKMQSFFTITPDVTKWTINGVTHWMKVPDMPADILDK